MNMLHIGAFAVVLIYGAIGFVLTVPRSPQTLSKVLTQPLVVLYLALTFYQQGLSDAELIVDDADLAWKQRWPISQAIRADLDATLILQIAILGVLLILGALYCYARLHPRHENGDPAI